MAYPSFHPRPQRKLALLVEDGPDRSGHVFDNEKHPDRTGCAFTAGKRAKTPIVRLAYRSAVDQILYALGCNRPGADAHIDPAGEGDVVQRCELARNNDPLRGVFRVQSRPL